MHHMLKIVDKVIILKIPHFQFLDNGFALFKNGFGLYVEIY
jgi:hypothetical protein